MKYIITENQRDRLFVLRRLDELENLIPNLYPYYYPCDYDSLGQYLLAMKIEMLEVTVLDWFEKVDKDVIWDVVTDVFRDLIVENFTTKCKSKIH